jgi:predicted TIM-barrel fold metal-dependent hydrolase
MLIDCDLHPFIEDLPSVYRLMPTRWRRRFEEVGTLDTGRAPDRLPFPGGTGWRDDAGTPGGGLAATDPHYVLKHHMEPNQIDSALLISVQAASVNAWTDGEQADVYTRAFNQALLDRWCGADSRYRLAATVSPLDPVRSAKEIRQYAKVDGVAGINVPAISILLGNIHFHPILKAAAESDLAIIVHPTAAEGAHQSGPTFSGIPNSYPEWKAVFSQVAHSNLASLIFEGAFERFPGLKVVFVEFGFSWLGPALWRMDQNWRDLRSSVPWVRRPPSEYVAESVRLTTQPMDDVGKREHFQVILEMAHAERTLMFSSDYPHYDNDNPFTAMAALPVEVRDRVRSENALDTFGNRIRPLAAIAAI